MAAELTDLGAERLLAEVAAMDPWYDDRGVNRCRFCEDAWEHAPDCLWLRVNPGAGT